MKQLFLFITIFFAIDLLAFTDSDFDGVEDSVDRCPNTPFTELVDMSGCSTKSLVSPHHYDIIVGANYSESSYQTLNQTDTLSSSLQVDYYYKNFSLQASTSYFTTEGNGFSDSGLYDSFIGASYQFKPLESLSLRVSVGAILPTYDTSLNNNKTDYTSSLNVSYSFNDMTLFAGYSYTMINDDNVVLTDINGTVATDVIYKNTNAYSVGMGYYFTDKLYVSGSYNTSNSIYDGVEDIETGSLYSYYSINENWFTTFAYAKGLSDTASKNYVSLRLGYFY